MRRDPIWRSLRVEAILAFRAADDEDAQCITCERDGGWRTHLLITSSDDLRPGSITPWPVHIVRPADSLREHCDRRYNPDTCTGPSRAC
jgi:hypothetical protein